MTESRPGFGLTQACEDYSINRCYFCNERYRSVSELQEHLKLCDSKPPSRAGTKAHAAAKRNYVNLHSGEDLQLVRLLCASGEELCRQKPAKLSTFERARLTLASWRGPAPFLPPSVGWSVQVCLAVAATQPGRGQSLWPSWQH
jgi:hypothetical protein